MGTIQPARFLSHSGQILPGVRRTLPVNKPAADTDWKVTVPSGVQWNVRAGTATLVTSATAGSRYAGVTVTVDGLLTWSITSNAAQAASETYPYSFTASTSSGYYASSAYGSVLPLPDMWLPEGTVIASLTFGLLAGDQWQNIALSVEEVYVTNGQLSEIERSVEAIDMMLARQAVASAGSAQNG